MDKHLYIEELHVGYNQLPILHGVQCDFKSGELTALIGRNGMGKSSFLRTLAGLQKPLSGKVFWKNKDLLTLSPRERAQHVSIVLTERIPLQGIDVWTLLEMADYPSIGGFRIFPRQSYELKQKIERSLEILGIAHLSAKSLAELSDGEMQKVMIARSLVQNTPVILMDEPTAFLDYVAKEELFEQLKSLVKTEDLLILFTSHDLDLVNRYADNIYKIEEGTILMT